MFVERSNARCGCTAGFGRLHILAPMASQVRLNGVSQPFSRSGRYIHLEQPAGLAMTVASPCDTLLFAGRTNPVKVKIWNRGTTPLNGSARITLAGDWKQRMESQLGWWGGIVNLVATNKGPVERVVVPGRIQGRCFMDRGARLPGGEHPARFDNDRDAERRRSQ